VNWATVFSYLGAGGLPTAGILAFLLRRKIKAEASKTGADAAAILTNTALESAAKSIAAVERRAEKVSAELDKAIVQIQALSEHVEELHDLLRNAGIQAPPFRFPPTLRIAPDAGGK
jgi:hypothetical protein